jgi:hypothetical protein
MAASSRPLPFFPRPDDRFAQSSSSGNCRASARLIALVTMRSSSGTDLDGSSAAKRSATALARSSGVTETTLPELGTVRATRIEESSAHA